MAPDADIVPVWPAHMVASFTDNTGFEFTVTVEVPETLQPPTKIAFTVYTVVVNGLTLTVWVLAPVLQA